MADVHPSWLCSDCRAEKRTDCALADPEITSREPRCWEPLAEGVDVTKPMPSDADTFSPDDPLEGEQPEPVYTAVLLPDGRVEHVRRAGVFTEDITDEESDSVHAVRRLPTVAEALSSPENVARREEEDAAQDAVAERLMAGLEPAHVMPLGEAQAFVAGKIAGVLGGPVVEPDDVVFSYRDPGLRPPSGYRWPGAEPRSEPFSELLRRPPGSPLRSVDLSRVEGKTPDEVFGVIRQWQWENHRTAINIWGQRFLADGRQDAREAQPSSDQVADWETAWPANDDDMTYELSTEEAPVDAWRGFKRGMLAGAALALGFVAAWAAGDRAWR